jgi:gamma-tubulin complex component 3
MGTPARPGPSTASVLAENVHIDMTEPVRAKLGSIDLSSSPRVAAGPPASKAELLRQWRTQRGRRPFPEGLLLRDALYLLQGIDGRYVRFALAPPPDKAVNANGNGNGAAGAGPNGNGNGDASLSMDRYDETEVLNDDEDEEIVGIDIVVDEPKVKYK